MSDLEREIRNLLAGFVAGQVPFAAFATSLAQRAWDIGDADPAAQDLAYAAELLMAEFTSGHRTEAELRRELGTLLGGAIQMEMVEPATIVTIYRGHGGVWEVASTLDQGRMKARVRSRATNAVRREAVHV